MRYRKGGCLGCCEEAGWWAGRIDCYDRCILSFYFAREGALRRVMGMVELMLGRLVFEV